MDPEPERSPKAETAGWAVLQPGTLVIEASTNLSGWAPVFTNTAPTNVLFYADPDAGSHRWRFYRAFQFP